jgi:hypothetical protein
VTFRLGGNKDARGARKSLSAFAAALVLASQLLAVSHYHQSDPVRRFNAQAQILADEGLCALCTLAFHLPLNPAIGPSLDRPQIDTRPIEQPVTHVIGLRPYSLSQTRAPPAATV